MEQQAQQADIVGDDETYARWIYHPRFMDDDEMLIERYVSLREREGNPKGPEGGLSGMLLERAGHDAVIKCGIAGKWKPKKNKAPETFWGYAYSKVGNIRSIAKNPDVIDVQLSPSETVPHHAIVIFLIDGEQMRGMTPNPRFRRYKEALLALLSSSTYHHIEADEEKDKK